MGRCGDDWEITDGTEERFILYSFSTTLLNPNTQKIAFWGKLRGKTNVWFIWGDDGRSPKRSVNN